MGSAFIDRFRGIFVLKDSEEEDELVSSAIEEALQREDETVNYFRRNVPVRHILTFMGFLSYTILNMMRVDMSVGIVCMVNWKDLSESPEGQSCSYNESSAAIRPDSEDGPFSILNDIQGFILSGYFYGLLATQYLGVILTERFSAKYVLLSGSLISSLCTVLIPAVADSSGIGLIFIQIFKGAGLGIIIPAFNILIGKWIPVSERFYSMSFIGCGAPFGRFLGTYASGLICKDGYLGWSYVFYIFAGIGFVICLLWVGLIFESPLTHPYITYNEMIQILKDRVVLPPSKKMVPWKNIFMSMHVWAYFILGFCSYWVLSIYTTLVPTFMSTVLKFDIEKAGAWSSLPYVFELILYIYSCLLSGKLIKLGRSRHATIHKWSIVVGLLGFAGFFSALPFFICNRIIAISCLVMAMAFYGIFVGSSAHVPMAMSPNYADKISLITNTLGAIAGIIPPTLIGILTKEVHNMEAWRVLFYISAAIAIGTLIIYIFFGATKTQKWNDLNQLELDSEPSTQTLDSYKDRPWRTSSFEDLPENRKPPVVIEF